MKQKSSIFTTVDAYITAQDPWVQDRLTSVRDLITDICPQAVESIIYNMPAYKYCDKSLIYFGAFPRHIGVYPTPPVVEAFAIQLKTYSTSKWSIQFPLDQPLPLDLIQEMIMYNMKIIDNL